MSTVHESAAAPARRRPRRRRRVLLVVVGVLSLLLVAAGAIVAVYLSGLARTVDEDVQRFDATVFPDDALRPQLGGRGAEGSDGGSGDGTGGDGQGQAADPGENAANGEGSTATVAMPELEVPGTAQGPEAAGADEAVDTGAVNVLLIGADSGNLDPDREIAEVRKVGRSDTMMWVHIPGDRQNVRVMSVMRDTWVPIPGHGDRKVNAAFALGGVPLAVRTVENMFQARIDHVVAVDMVGFRDLVDALGGVTVDNPRAFTGSGIDFAAGPIHLDGTRALAFARERYAFADGDYSRVANQQRLVKAIIDKALSRSTLTNPAGVQNAVESFAPFLTFDSTLDSGRLFEIAWTLRNLRGGDIDVSTVPTNGVGTVGDQSVVWPDWASIRQIGRSVRTGEGTG